MPSSAIPPGPPDSPRRRAVVTGGGTGLGLAIARRLLGDPVHPADVVLVGRRLERLEAAQRELGGIGSRANVTAHGCDLRDPDAVQSLADALGDGPPVDVLVLNAGGSFGGEGSGLTGVADQWRADFDGNVLTAVLLTEALLPHLSRPGGRIVAMSSVSGVRGNNSYGAAKAAVNAWVWWMSGRVAREGITVNAVAPGFVPDTDFWVPRIAADPSLLTSRVSGIPMGRAGTPDEVAEAVAYLASPDAGWTSGQILGINGGSVLGR